MSAARLPELAAVGFPLESSAAEALPQAGPRESRETLIAGTAQTFEPDGFGVAVWPAFLAMAACDESTANPPVEPVGLVGHGLVVAADDRQAPVPMASARLLLAASASDPPPVT